ncbi:MAG: hypothetical protein QM708_14765 [Propioniciclava sp.]|uniref:hypothetical protein n=1 Tax=Propioniciclava sp. TaxID=2038686 RepID=UPI0039E23549
MRRCLTVLALVWLAFVIIFPFAAAGDTSFLHITFHVIQLMLVVPALWLVNRVRVDAVTRPVRWTATLMIVTLIGAIAGIVGEMAVAVARLAHDGWVDRDTADLWEHGPHVTISTLTIPSMMLSMLLSVVLVVVMALGRRSSGAARSRESVSR